MLFGGGKQACDDITNSTTCANPNLNYMDTYNQVAFVLYQFTFGSDLFSRDSLNRIDPIMTDLLMGSFLGLTSLLMINIFIAMLTATFNTVHESSKAYFLLQRASEILQFQYMLSDTYMFKHYTSLKNDIQEDRFTIDLIRDDFMQSIIPLKESIALTKREIKNFKKKLKVKNFNYLNNNFSKHPNLSKMSSIASDAADYINQQMMNSESETAAATASEAQSIQELRNELGKLKSNVSKLLKKEQNESKSFFFIILFLLRRSFINWYFILFYFFFREKNFLCFGYKK